MKLITIIITLIFLQPKLYGQQEKITKAKFILGISGPELLHAGVTYRIANVSLVGLNAGLGPTFGGVWPSLSFENRIYFAKNDARTAKKSWFCRQGTTFFPSRVSPQRFTGNLTFGKDISFKRINNGITIDAGVFYLAPGDNSSFRPSGIWPALRFELYLSE